MADINVERKGPSIWPWIIGLVVVALLIWALAELLGDGEEEVMEPVATEEVAPASPAGEEPLADEEEAVPQAGALAAGLPEEVTSFAQTCTAGPQGQIDAGVQHEFTVNCLNNLADALDAMIERNAIAGADVEQRLTSLREAAQQLEQSEPEAATHAGMARDAFVSATELMESIQQTGTAASDIGDEVTEVRTAAESVQAEVGLLEQQDAVRTFFSESVDVLEDLAERPASA